MVSCFDRKGGKRAEEGKRKEGKGGREGKKRKGRRPFLHITIQPRYRGLSQTVHFAKCHGSLLKQWKLHNTSIAPLYKIIDSIQ